MVSSFTTNKNIEKPAHNDYVDDWDVPVNGNMNTIDACLGSVTAINMTGLSSYTFGFADIQSTTIRFTGTLNSGVIPVELTNGVSGQFTIIDATTPTDSTSRISLGWTSGGTSYSLFQGATRLMSADGGGLVWRPASANALPLLTQFNLSTFGGGGTFNLTADQLSTGLVIFTGTCPNTTVLGSVPSGFVGSIDFIGAFSNAGGSSILGIQGVGGGIAQQISPGHNYRVAFTSNTQTYLIGST